ncbi:restriction endonuclease subunit S [Aureispira anguillae]|uniref:Restriction endonuclease subunit S n=1 Tax=Aureispira anguillae TaxID=2864201 RepID=A0A915YGP1_9BACT|nr:restriction endonuclease subunit S [Aureispira anguillae]BDS12705.1 restriction endonuclease subunit S [Aureispira anguillae]
MNTVKQKIKKTKFPLLRFLEFTDSWTSILIEEIINRVSKPVDVEATTLYQQIGIRSHGKGIFYKEHVTGKSLGNKRVFWVQPNMFIVNIVFAWEHAVARTTEKELGMIASHRFPMYEPIKNKVDLDFLMYFFLRKRGKYLLGLASPGGAGRNKTLGQQTFAKLKVNIPTLPEQQKIANFLSSVDKKIEQLRQKVSLLEDYKKGVMQQIFSQQIRFKDDNGEAFVDWEVSSLGKKAIIGKGFTPSTKDSKYWKGTNKWLSIADMRQGKYIFDTKKKITDIAIKGKQVLKEGTLIMSFKLTLGRLGIIQSKMFTNEAICNFKWKDNSISTQYMYYYLSSINVKSFGSQAAKGITLNNASLDSITVKLPVYKEQQKIANFLSSIDDKIQQTQTQLAQTQQFKKGLLQQMFV